MTLRATPHPANVLDGCNRQASNLSDIPKTCHPERRGITRLRVVPRTPLRMTGKGYYRIPIWNSVMTEHRQPVDFFPLSPYI
jgi:hypothetical protein